MKSLSKTMCAIGCTLFFLSTVFMVQAQMPKNQKFLVHEDMVMPGKIAEYEAAAKTLAKTMSEHNATSSAFLTVSLDDMRYLHVRAIENLAALDANPFESVVEAMGEEKFDNMMSGYDNTYETHKNYVINLSYDLSYNSEEIVMDGVNFRHFTYYFVDPDQWDEAKSIAKEWKERYNSVNAPHGYRIYTGGLGTEPMIMVVQWAKSAKEFYANQAENQSALGDVEDLRDRTMAITRKTESYEGWIRPDLSYQPKTAMAEN